MAENNRNNWNTGSYRSDPEWENNRNRYNEQDDYGSDIYGSYSYSNSNYMNDNRERNRFSGNRGHNDWRQNTGNYGDMNRYGGDREHNMSYGRQSDYNRYGRNNWQDTDYGNHYHNDRSWDNFQPGAMNSYGQRQDWGRGDVNLGMNDYPGYNQSAYGGYTGRDMGRRNFDNVNDMYRGNRPARNMYGGDTANHGNANQGGYDRDWWDKTRDEVSSWFGDDDAERRRNSDRRMDTSYRGRGPKDYNRSEDRIREDVCDRLTDDSWLDATDVQVQVLGNEVLLRGNVSSREQKRRAEDVVESISGVRNVENRIRVNHPEDRHERNREGNAENNWR